MAKINEIIINGFKAFPSKFELNFEGKHLLMYGENGSGKSSIYYALHCLFNSIRKPDYGKKYFDINNCQNLINKHFVSKGEGDIPYVAVNWLEGVRSPFLSVVTQEGCKPSQHLMELDTCFINHQFLFGFFSFTNSRTINLFPIFQKEIFPYIFDDSQDTYISLMYEAIANVANTLGNKKSTKDIDNSINYYNHIIYSIIEEINLRASEIYNDRFRSEDDRKLKIKLIYPETDDLFDESNLTGYWLKYDKQQITLNGEIKRASNKSLNMPLIRLEITEKGDSKPIEKPQTYFNEAKLTAIALSIRFSLINLDSPKEGSFLALDDMLISLDMSNRAKVVDFLLNISDKYKIYLFTHDKAFYKYCTHKISQCKKANEWVCKNISYDSLKNEPIVIDEYADYLSKSNHFYRIGDYETAAIYARKQLEQSVGELLPYELKVRADGGFVDLQTLWNKLVVFYSNNSKPLEPSMQTLFTDSKLLILNVAAHFQRLSNPIYRIEVDNVFKLILYVQSLEKISNKLIIEGGKQIIFQHPTIDYKCSFELDSDLEIIQDEHIVARIPKCKNIRWAYNGVDNWDFVTNQQNNKHALLAANPRFTDFFQRFPLGITCDMLIKHSKIEGVIALIDYFGGIDLLKLSVKTV